MSNQKIHVIVTGGTIDSEWDPAADTAVSRDESILPKYLARLQTDFEFTYNTVCMKDSRQLTPDDLKLISEAVKNSPTDKILVSHGTYTMPDTARYIEAHLRGGV